MNRSSWRTFGAALELLRPANALISAAGVVVGGILARDGGAVTNTTLWLAALSAALVAGGGNAINDIYDRETDRINRPDRPIPSGRISSTGATVEGVSLLAGGVGLVFGLSLGLGLTALTVSGLLWSYSLWWKKVPLLGNAIVALCGSLPLVYGALAVGALRHIAIPTLFAFVIHLGREIVKDCEDVAGDRARGAKTLPMVLGQRRAQRVAAVILLVLAVSVPFPYFSHILSIKYLLLSITTAALPLLLVIVGLIRGQASAGLRRASLILKLAMIGGLASLYVG